MRPAIWARLLVATVLVGLATMASGVEGTEASTDVSLAGPSLQYTCTPTVFTGPRCDDRIEGYANGNQLGCPGVACADEHTQIIWIMGNGQPVVIVDRASLGVITQNCPDDGPYYFVLHWEQKAVFDRGEIAFGSLNSTAFLGCRLPAYEP
ncbi:MAG: hypothetical protein QOK43_2520 [Acidimicrobiaceae bacterium]|nr:hypothetical protein [Acidimicrobiaceae bacterium]